MIVNGVGWERSKTGDEVVRRTVMQGVLLDIAGGLEYRGTFNGLRDGRMLVLGVRTCGFLDDNWAYICT